MNDAVANTQLELASRLGLLEDVIEALDDGANIDCNGCSPLFFAMENAEREVVAALVDRGADVGLFGVDRSAQDVVEQLLLIGSQSNAKNEAAEDGIEELDAKMIRAFDRMLRNKGMGEPIKKGRLGEYAAFFEGLRSLAAEDCQAVVGEFLEWIQPAKGGDAEAAANLVMVMGVDENSERLQALGERYAKATAEEQPGELLKDYLKDSKKKQ